MGDEDLGGCADALARMEEALLSGSDPDIRSAARAIAWSGGLRPQGDLTTWLVEIHMQDPDARPTDRPWLWLAAVADEANARGDARLAARVGFFVHGWREQVAPRMGIADAEDCGGIQLVPNDAYARILAAAVQALAPLHPEEKIVRTSESFVPVSTLLPALAGALLTLERAGVPVDLRARDEALHAAT